MLGRVMSLIFSRPLARLDTALDFKITKFNKLELTMKQSLQNWPYSETQLAQRQHTETRLRHLHEEIRQLMQRTLHSFPTSQEYALIGERLAIFATQIKSLVQRRAQILLVAVRENQCTVNIIFTSQCSHCAYLEDNPYNEIAQSQNPHADLILEIDSLLELTHQAEECVSARCAKLPPPTKFFRNLTALKRALAYEQKPLLRKGEGVQDFNVIFDESTICKRCGKPFDDKVSDGSPDESILQ
jgi:hypothetical protein